MHSWNGGWSWSNVFNARKYIVEIPCVATLVNPLMNENELQELKTLPFQNDVLIEKIYPNPVTNLLQFDLTSTQDRILQIQILALSAL